VLDWLPGYPLAGKKPAETDDLEDRRLSESTRGGRMIDQLSLLAKHFSSNFLKIRGFPDLATPSSTGILKKNLQV